MGEIKFRAWDRKERKMLYNVEHTYDTLRNDCMEDSFGDVLNDTERYDVMQYTGIHDGYDNEIYEGDIVRVDGYLWEVYWDEKTACFSLEDEAEGLIATFDNYRGDECEVFGNIYENPELMEDTDAT